VIGSISSDARRSATQDTGRISISFLLPSFMQSEHHGLVDELLQLGVPLRVERALASPWPA
jgi:hypothetical protein